MKENDQEPAQPRKSLPPALFMAGALVVIAVLVAGYWAWHGPKEHTQPAPLPPPVPSQTNASSTLPPTSPPPVVPAVPVAPANATNTAQAGGPMSLTAVLRLPSATGEKPGVSLPPASLHARQLITNLSELRLEEKRITAGQAAAWKEALESLTKEGAAAPPAILEFLDRSVDLVFDGLPGGDQMGYGSLRLALFDVLKQVKGPEALAVSLHALQSAADPREIAMLAHSLEQLNPGQHKEEVLNSVRASLNMAAAQQLQGRDVNPLFEILNYYGQLTDLENTAERWHFYATIALAQIPDGQGIASLMRLAQPESGLRVSARGAALSLLAQLAEQSPEARQTLVDQARRKQIPSVAWPDLGTALAGNQYQFKNQFFENGTPPPSDPSKFKAYHISFGNQNFYAHGVAENWTPEQLQARLALIDELIAANSDPVAVPYLQTARSRLAVLQPQR